MAFAFANIGPNVVPHIEPAPPINIIDINIPISDLQQQYWFCGDRTGYIFVAFDHKFNVIFFCIH